MQAFAATPRAVRTVGVGRGVRQRWHQRRRGAWRCEAGEEGASAAPRLSGVRLSRRALLQSAASLALGGWAAGALDGSSSVTVPAAAARSGLSVSSGAVNKDPESLLRWALPMNNQALRRLQTELESVFKEVRQRHWGQVVDALRKAKSMIERDEKRLTADITTEDRIIGHSAIIHMMSKMKRLLEAAEAKEAEPVEEMTREMLRVVGAMEELSVKGFPYEVPDDCKSLPLLLGRATVEIVLRKGDEPGRPKQFDIDGNLYDRARMVMVIDGYSAPVTGGNFVDLVSRGFYDGLKITRSDGFVVQTGDPDPDGTVHGFVDPQTKQLRTIPLEVFAKGDKMPLYHMSLDEDGRGGQPTVLPLTAYGSLCFAREEFSPDSGSSQFFWFLFEPDLTPAGRNLVDGSFASFGYTVEGAFFLRNVEVGDVIESCKVIRGLDCLRQPTA